MIVFRTVSKLFDDEYALQDVSLSVEPGELVMITGPSGSGKTTLMRLLTREYKPTTGEILFDSVPLSKIGTGQIHHHRRKIGVIFQDYKLLPELNVWENIALALSIIGTKDDEIERRVTDLLELVSLTDKAFHFPIQLSGGEAQRVSIARALSTAPKVIFADEPTGNLDSTASKNIILLLKKINSLGTTVLITTHNHDVQKWLGETRHIHIENGKLVRDSGMKETEVKKSDVKDTQKQEEEPREMEPEVKESDEKNHNKKVEAENQKGKSRFQLPTLSLFSRKKTDEKVDKNEAESESQETADASDKIEIEVENL